MRANSIRLLTTAVFVLVVLSAIALQPRFVHASGPWYVKTSGNNSNDCTSPVTACASINAALNKPGFVAGDTINVAVGTYTGSGTEVVLLNKSAIVFGGWDTTFTTQSGMSMIDGQNGRQGIVVNAGIALNLSKFTIINTFGGGVGNSGTLTITDIIFQNNTTDSSGGGIYNAASGILNISNSTFFSNRSIGYLGGGIYNGGTLGIFNSTFYSNSAGYGGAIHNTGILTLTNSTLSANIAVTSGGGIRNEGSATFRNTIIANNASSSNGNCDASVSITDGGNNLQFNPSSGCASMTSGDPKLGPLMDNGGPTLTMALMPGSAALDAGNNANCPPTDQRGMPRFGNCDIGAYELVPIDSSSKSASPSLVNPGTSLAYTITLSNTSAVDLVNVVVTDTLPITITYINSSLTASSGSYGFSSGVITWTGTLYATANVSITFGAMVNLYATPGNIVNAAIINVGGVVLTRTASVVIPASINADLSNLVLSDGTLTPVFASGTTAYTTTVANNITNITVTPTTADATATVKVNNVTVASGSPSSAIGLNVGANLITTVVTAQDGTTTKTYIVTVTRVLLSSLVFLPLIAKQSTPTPTPTPTLTPIPGGYSTILSTDFEGTFPSPWVVFDNNGGSYGEYYWGKRNCRAYSGSYSGWAVGGGANGAGLGCGSNYPDNAQSWMVYGPFSLSGATAADLKFKLWLNSESTYDGVCRLASVDGTNFNGTCTTGNSGGWIDRVLDLTSVPTLGNLTGQPSVWVAIIFASDVDTNFAEGAYVDDIVLRKCSTGCTGLRPLLPSNTHIQEMPTKKIRLNR